MLPNTGERQIHRELKAIKPNHRERYKFAMLRIRYEHELSSRPIEVLDAACGIGYGTTILSHAHPGIYTGVDISSEVVAEANTYYRNQNIGGNSAVEYKPMDLANDEDWKQIIGDHHYDAIVSIETIEHVADADKLIQHFADRTDFLIGSVPNEDVVPFDSSKHPFHFRHYTKGQFEELLKDHGFEVEMWATQYNKNPGTIINNDDGMGFIVSARKIK